MAVDVEAAWLSLRTQLVAHRPGPSGRAREPAAMSTPVCLLTGFLGAGKSFLLAELLTRPPDNIRIRAIVNDVGTLDFDPTLIESANDIRVELTNGCGCCERTTELAGALTAHGDDPECDLIVLEASGAADPLAVAQIIAADPALRLDRIVAVVPAMHLAAPTLPESMAPIVHRQIDSSHCVIVSGCDLVADGDADAAVERVSLLAPGRTVTRSSFESPAIGVLTPAAPIGARPAPSGADAVHRALAVVTVVQRREPTMTELRSALIASRPGLVRVKGRLVVDGRPRLVQLTPQTIDITDITEAQIGPTGLTMIAAEHADAQPLIDLVDLAGTPIAPISPSSLQKANIT